MADGKVVIDTSLDTEGIKQGLSKMGSLAATGAKAAVTAITGVSAAFIAASGYAASFGTEYKSASNILQTQTGATKEEMEGLSQVMKNVYADNFGDDMSDVANAVAQVKKNLGGTDTEIEKATEAAFGFRDTFGYDIPESTRAASAIVKNFGGTAEEAFDLMAAGAQNGLDYSGELIDTINEYSVQFAKAGLSAEDMFNILQSGADVGAWNLDKIGDAVKELNIRLVDGSTTTAEGLEAIGMNADEVAQKMSQGGEVAKETYSEVVRRLADMDDAQQQNIAGVNLFGTMWEDLGPEVVAQLATMSGVYNDVKGTMESINQIRYDDVGAALEALKRKAQVSLVLPISEDIMPAISSATEAAIGYIEDLANAYESEGVEGLISKSAEIFADIATEAAKQAPQMVKAAANFIKSFAKGISSNKDELIAAAGSLVKTFASSLASLLPKSVREPVQKAIDEIAKSFESGGLKKAIQTVVNLFKNLANAASKVLGPALDVAVSAIDLLAGNLDILIPLLSAGVAAFTAWKIVGTITSLLTAHKATLEMLTAAEAANALQVLTAAGALTTKEVIVGVLTGKITLATAATWAWNAAMSALGGPIGLIVAAVAALGIGIAAYNASQEETVSEMDAWISKHEEVLSQLDETNEKLQENIDKRGEAIEKAEVEAGSIDILADHLLALNEKQDKTNEEKAQMSALVDELNEKLPDLGLVIDEETGYLDMNEQAIRDVIEANKEMIMVKAAQSQLTEIAEDLVEAEMNLKDAEDARQETVEALFAKQSEWNDLYAQSQEEAEKYGQATYETTEKLRELSGEIEQLKTVRDSDNETVEAASQAIEDLNAQYDEYSAYIGEHQAAINASARSFEDLGASADLTAAVMAEDSDAIVSALENITNGFKTASTSNRAELEQQVTDLENNTELMKMALREGVPGVTQEMVDALSQLTIDAQEELGKLPPEVKNAVDGSTAAVQEGTPAYGSATQQFAEAGKTGFDSGGLSDHIIEESSKAASGSAQEMNAHQEENYVAAAGLSTAMKSGLDSGNIPEHFGTTSTEASDNLINNTVAKYPEVQSAAEGTNLVYKSGLGNPDLIDYYAKTGKDSPQALASGSNSQLGVVEASGSAVGNASKDGVDVVDPYTFYLQTGRQSGAIFADGIQSKASLASLAGQTLANAADNALRSIDGYGAGAEFAAGYANGIWGGIGAAVAAAASMASQAIAAVKAEQASASPSKKTRKLAHDFGDGYAGGIRDKEDDVAEAASELSDTAMDALDFTGIDVSSMVSKMKQAVFQDKAAVAGMMSAQFVNKAYREVNV